MLVELGRWRVIEFNDVGELASPVAIAGFEGWNDAGEAASGVVNHLGIAWQATPIGAIDPEDFYDFQVNRPVVEIEDGHTQRLIWPTTRISLARAQSADVTVPPTGLSRDIVLVHGIEPNMRWRAFSEELVQGLESLGVGLIILLGALLADAPHTRPVPVSVGSSNSKLGVDELAQQDSEVADYVRTLEEAKDAMDLPEASGDAIAREFERYFRRHGDAGESAGPGGI